MTHSVTVFKPYPFKIGQKINIDGSKRGGDWEVVDITDTKVSLRCPISKVTVKWDRFCYFVEDNQQQWPKDDD